MTLRAATPADLDAIMTIERASFVRDAWSEQMMAAELASPHNHYVVAEQAGRVIGYAGLRAPSGSHDGDIQTIALSADARGRGAGRELLTTLLEQASLRGVRDVFLDVRVDNTVAQSLYRSVGFREIGIRPNYYAAEGVDALVMQLDVPAWSDAHRGQATHGADARGAC
ncbi:ribosomal protein S18-alanine N-acetyltransferase [Microbacterium sp. W1N]|uniref:ribosomal protein S18-alanine N-acetyltransferase n=1 Tax=Microbacterium festucae TaxID=2977531 RepID=UPI0021BFC167|nr:ribosomal protein S18-alanine N-acetyltransferase [Microbacterium festucae]MCT9818973.1 ribosomal protein S18-alanine N-acetyltransferase [Microbacterium festucae]